MRPAFIGLGAQKCASTWLHRILGTHPEVVLPDVKEIDFFSCRFDHGYQWYERQFPACSRGQCTGEVSPSYFHDVRVPDRVKAYAPDVRLLVTLRDPVDRALSNHRHEVRLGHFDGDDLSFEAGLANNPMYLEQSRYAKHLSNWMRVFPAGQIHVILVEDIQQRPASVAGEVFRFLGIDDSFRPPVLTRRFNVSFVNRSQGLVRLKDSVYRMSRSPGMSWLWSAATGIGARDLYRRLNVAESGTMIPSVCPQTLAELRSHLAADVRRLEELLGRDLTHWLPARERPAGRRIGGGE